MVKIRIYYKNDLLRDYVCDNKYGFQWFASKFGINIDPESDLKEWYPAPAGTVDVLFPDSRGMKVIGIKVFDSDFHWPSEEKKEEHDSSE